MDVRCVAVDEEPPRGWAPWMPGLGAVRLGEPIEQLRETLAERQQVLAAIRTGRRGAVRVRANGLESRRFARWLAWGGTMILTDVAADIRLHWPRYCVYNWRE